MGGPGFLGSAVPTTVDVAADCGRPNVSGVSAAGSRTRGEEAAEKVNHAVASAEDCGT